ncbi:hypothetical protein [Mycobacteroides abscessus]|uniref:hypothetical protein n=1 Tax=Mycobacteroides abscessus TaxID=36809 RepID=UPI0021067753|nr:hypothetical protein [Mycobacteroides abscessus]
MTTTEYPHHPLVTELLGLAAEGDAQHDRYHDMVAKTTTTAKDATETVAVTVNTWGWWVGLWFSPGLLQKGATEVSNRINDALRRANALAQQTAATLAQDHQRELDAINLRATALLEKLAISDPAAPVSAEPLAAAADDDRW